MATIGAMIAGNVASDLISKGLDFKLGGDVVKHSKGAKARKGLLGDNTIPYKRGGSVRRLSKTHPKKKNENNHNEEAIGGENSGIDKSVLEQHCHHDCTYSLNDKWSQLETSPLPAYSRQTLDWMATSSLPKENDRWQPLFELHHYKVVNGPMYIYAPSARKQSMK